MRKLARIVGVIGGLVAIAWAMRDRFISIASPREPEPPAFRVASPPPSVPELDELTALDGIGPVTAAKLRASGITSFAELATADPRRVAEASGLPESKVNDWITQAAEALGHS